MRMTSEEQNDGERSTNCIEIICLTSVVLITLAMNLVIGWSAVLPKIEADTSSFIVTKEDVSLLISLLAIMGIVASCFTGSLTELLGPRLFTILVLFPMAAFWLMMAFAPHITYLYVGRVGLATIVCCLTTTQHPLLAELSTPGKRGFVSSSAEITAAAVMMLGYIVAYFLPWRMATIACAVPCVIIFLLMLFVPESPYWLVRKNKKDKAEQALRRLRGPAYVSEHLEIIESTVVKNEASLLYQVSLLSKRQNALPVFLLCLITLLREWGGKNAMFSYSVYIFRQAEVELDPFICTILIGAIRMAGHFISAFTIDRLGRRPLLIGTSISSGLCVVVTGLFFQLQLPGRSWVSLALLLLFTLSYGIGIGPIPWMYMGELIPNPVRPLGASIMVFTYNLGIFAVNYTFFEIIDQLGLGLSLIIFSIPNFLVMIITVIWLPETKGRSLDDLQNIFRKERRSSPSTIS